MDLGPTQNMFDTKQNHCHLTLDSPPTYMKHFITFTAKLCVLNFSVVMKSGLKINFLKNASMYDDG